MFKIKIISGSILLCISGISYAQYANVEKLNDTASCDSTCSVEPSKIQTLSGQNQRTANCGYGYIGHTLEERVINADGSWSNWREVNRDNCACSPLTENQEIACPTNQRGQHIQKRDWTCPSIAQGAYTKWVTKSNNCSYYYLSTSAEEQEISCPSNQRGKHIQTRTYENWSDGNARNHKVWSTKSNTCDYYLIAASQTEVGSATCPSGYNGSITQIRTYDLWSDGSKKNYGGWTQTANNCVLIGLTVKNFVLGTTQVCHLYTGSQMSCGTNDVRGTTGSSRPTPQYNSSSEIHSIYGPLTVHYKPQGYTFSIYTPYYTSSINVKIGDMTFTLTRSPTSTSPYLYFISGNANLNNNFLQTLTVNVL